MIKTTTKYRWGMLLDELHRMGQGMPGTVAVRAMINNVLRSYADAPDDAMLALDITRPELVAMIVLASDRLDARGIGYRMIDKREAMRPEDV